MSERRIYLDHHATAPLLPEARAAMISAMELVGNASSIHYDGRSVRAMIETSRKAVASRCGALAKSVVFTGSATEALTQAIIGGAQSLDVGYIVLSAGEHKAVFSAAEKCGLEIRICPLDALGGLDFVALGALLDEIESIGSRALVALHWVNGETGIVQDLAKMGAIVGASPHYLLIDGVQGFGKLDMDFAGSAIDMMAVSAHKIGGPQGVGALIMKAHCDNVRLIPGGGQELARRGGTEPSLLIAGFGAAVENFTDQLADAKCTDLIAHFEQGLKALDPNVVIFADAAPRIGTVSNFALPTFDSAVTLMRLDLAGVSISSGSACSSGKVSRSHVLEAMGVTESLMDCALRLSVGWNSRKSDVDKALTEIGAIVNTKTNTKPLSQNQVA